MLKLIIRKKDKTVSDTVVCWSSATEKAILPKRDPDHKVNGEWKWKISFDKRDVFSGHVFMILDKFCDSKENLYGFFGLSGIVAYWSKDEFAEWWVVKTRKGVKECLFP